MMDLANLSVLQLYRAASSLEPTPGGGSITALCGTLGIGLVLKAVRVSARRHPANDPSTATELDAELNLLAMRLLEFADTDRSAFQSYITALKLPRLNIDEKTARSKALENAANAATASALLTLETASQAISIAKRLEGSISENIRADMIAGIKLLDVVIAIATENAKVNMSSIGSGALRSGLEERLDRAERAGKDTPSK